MAAALPARVVEVEALAEWLGVDVELVQGALAQFGLEAVVETTGYPHATDARRAQRNFTKLLEQLARTQHTNADRRRRRPSKRRKERNDDNPAPPKARSRRASSGGGAGAGAGAGTGAGAGFDDEEGDSAPCAMPHALTTSVAWILLWTLGHKASHLFPARAARALPEFTQVTQMSLHSSVLHMTCQRIKPRFSLPSVPPATMVSYNTVSSTVEWHHGDWRTWMRKFADTNGQRVELEAAVLPAFAACWKLLHGDEETYSSHAGETVTCLTPGAVALSLCSGSECTCKRPSNASPCPCVVVPNVKEFKLEGCKANSATTRALRKANNDMGMKLDPKSYRVIEVPLGLRNSMVFKRCRLVVVCKRRSVQQAREALQLAKEVIPHANVPTFHVFYTDVHYGDDYIPAVPWRSGSRVVKVVNDLAPTRATTASGAAKSVGAMVRQLNQDGHDTLSAWLEGNRVAPFKFVCRIGGYVRELNDGSSGHGVHLKADFG